MKSKFDYNSNFYRILDAIPASVYWKDLSGKYLGCNKYMAEMNKMSREDIIGKTDYDLIWKDAAKDLQEIDRTVIKNKAKYEIEEMSTFGTDTQRIYLSTKTPLYDEKEKVIGMIGISVNITERKNAERLREEGEKKAAAQISRAMEMLSGNIAHEIKTPLAIISVCTDNLCMELKDLLGDADKEEKRNKINGFVKNIKSAIYSANNIITTLLVKLRSMLSRASNEHKNFKPTSIKSCIDAAIKEYPFCGSEREYAVWDGKNIDFNYYGDQFLTKHLLFNLIKNSLRAIKEVDKGKIYISLRPDKDFNYLIFRDTALGIPHKKLKSIFQQFGSDNQEGSGLGLAFCKMIMKSYGGDIICDSKEGEYTEFTLSFPRVRS